MLVRHNHLNIVRILPKNQISITRGIVDLVSKKYDRDAPVMKSAHMKHQYYLGAIYTHFG